MTQAQTQFIELLRSGLWGTPADTSLFQGEVDWKSILRTAKEQTVQVIVADGIETLPAELWPPKELMFKLMAIRIKTKQMHLRLNSALIKITQTLQQTGIPSTLLKGQGVAHNYRLPESRMCGDIDLYVGKENFEKASDVICTLNPTQTKEEIEDNALHRHFDIDDVTLELHQKASSSANKRQSRLFDAWTKANLDSHFSDSTLPVIDFTQTPAQTPDCHPTSAPVQTPSANYNAVFILHHAARHMITEGIGLRQICDWTMFLDKHHADIDQEQLKADLSKFHMEAIWKEFSILAVNLLGLDSQHLPLAPARLTSNKTEKILEQILAYGNFGQYDKKGRSSKETNLLKRKWRSLWVQTRHFRKNARLFPRFTLSYAAGWYPDAIARLFRRK